MKHARIKGTTARDGWWVPILRRLEEARSVCVDLETSGLDWKRHHIVGWVLTFSEDPSDSYYLPVRHAAGGNLMNFRGPHTADGWNGSLHPIESAILRALDQQGKVVFGHNFAFDLKFMWRLRELHLDARFEDTQVNAALLDENQGTFSLRSCCHIADVQRKKDDEIYAHLKNMFPDGKPGEEMENFWRLAGDDPHAIEYAEGDGTSTWQLRDWQAVKLEKERLLTVHDVECRLLPVLVRMSCRGIRIDEERVHQLIAQIDSGDMERQLGFPEGFNCKAPVQVEEWLREQGFSAFRGTLKNGRPQLNEAFLSTFELGQKIVQLRRLRTLKDSFLRPMLETHLWNGRVHANYHQTKVDEYGVVTGRLSCSDPNLQQGSKRNPEIGRLHRSIFIPDEGMIWGSADYKQCEPVLLAVYSRARVLIDGFWAVPPVDAHSAVTKATNRKWASMPQADFDAAGIAITPEFKAAREIGKRVNQTLITGGGQGVLTEKYGIPKEDVSQIWDDYFAAMPEIKRLQKAAGKKMRRTGFVRSLLGRKARLEYKNRSYIAVNRLLQCGNADILKLKMVQIDEYLKSEGRPIDLLNNVHDSIDFQFVEGNRHHWVEALNIMTDFGPGQPIVLDVPLDVDYDEGRDWAIATFGEEKS